MIITSAKSSELGSWPLLKKGKTTKNHHLKGEKSIQTIGLARGFQECQIQIWPLFFANSVPLWHADKQTISDCCLSAIVLNQSVMLCRL